MLCDKYFIDLFKDLKSLEGYKIRFEDVGHPLQSRLKIQYDGVPFIIVGNDTYECNQAPSHGTSKNEQKVI